MGSDTRHLVTTVVNGNPGACTIVVKLMALPIWHQLLHHLKSQGLIGSALWQEVKDHYDHDWLRFVDDQLALMAPERGQALRVLSQPLRAWVN
jgi:hypothetical protein